MSKSGSYGTGTAVAWSMPLPDVPKGYWHYANFDNGVKIPKPARLLFRERADLFEYFDNPFSTSGDSYFEWLRRKEPSILAAG